MSTKMEKKKVKKTALMVRMITSLIRTTICFNIKRRPKENKLTYLGEQFDMNYSPTI